MKNLLLNLLLIVILSSCGKAPKELETPVPGTDVSVPSYTPESRVQEPEPLPIQEPLPVPTLPETVVNGSDPFDRKDGSWQIVYNGRFTPQKVDFIIIDLFEFSRMDVEKINDIGAQPIAYFSAHYEDWRPDEHNFGKKLGKIGKWKGEYYIDWTDKKNQEVMTKRLDKAMSMGFVGVDIDNVDGPGGFYYFPWLMKQAKERGLKVGLKNFVEYLPKSGGESVDFFVSEATVKSELDCYKKFGKPTVRMYYNRGAATPSFIYPVENGKKGSRF